MEKQTTPLEFWSQVWQEGTIRFHQAEYNPHMISFFKEIDLKNKSVLIPLAGKTKDILYFLEKGASVTAIEFCEVAVIDFFKENNISYKKIGKNYKAFNLDFFCGDFFDFESTASFDVLYDRAAQVVFTQPDRPKYYQHISKLISKSTLVLLFSIDHAGSPEYGPPYKISKDEMLTHFEKMGITLRVFQEAAQTPSDKMKEAGIESLTAFTMNN